MYNVTMWHIPIITALKCKKKFPFYCFWHRCSCQQYKCVHCWYWNSTLDSLCTVVELHSISYCCSI